MVEKGCYFWASHPLLRIYSAYKNKTARIQVSRYGDSCRNFFIPVEDYVKTHIIFTYKHIKNLISNNSYVQ